MRDVILRGTGLRARALGRRDLSGKTGTSNDRRDAWFGGFNGNLASIVWVGYDDDLPLGPGEEGSRTALPIWIEFLRAALAGVPENQMPMPDGMTSVRIGMDTGCPASHGQSNVTFEVFRVGHVPECESVEEPPDPFNDTTGIFGQPDDEPDDANDSPDEIVGEVADRSRGKRRQTRKLHRTESPDETAQFLQDFRQLGNLVSVANLPALHAANAVEGFHAQESVCQDHRVENHALFAASRPPAVDLSGGWNTGKIPPASDSFQQFRPLGVAGFEKKPHFLLHRTALPCSNFLESTH